MRQAFHLEGAQPGVCPDQPVPEGLDLQGRTPAQWNDELRLHAAAYVHYVRGLIPVSERDVPLAVIIVEEQRVDASSISADLFGTVDTIIWLPRLRCLIVIDYKYGFRVVEVGTVEEANPQLAAYAVAAVEKLGQTPQTIGIAIYQPRVPLREPASFLPVLDAPAWLQVERAKLTKEVAAVAQGSMAPNPGEHCRYCKAASSCSATQSVLQASLGIAAGTRDMLSIPTDELLALWSARNAWKAFWEDMEARIEALAKVGHARLAVKESQGRKMWADPKAATLTLLALGRTDLLQPVALSDALPAMPPDVAEDLVTRSRPSRSIQVVDAPPVKEVAKIFEKYANKA